MTREETVLLLRRYAREAYRYQTGGYVLCAKRNADYQAAVYGRFLVEELIRSIRRSAEEPIRIVRSFYSALDRVLGDSDDDHFETHRFAARMEHEAGNVLRYLQSMEKHAKGETEDELTKDRNGYASDPEA